MFLAFDIGNSTLVAALFDRDNIIARISVSSTIQRSTDEMWETIRTFLSTNAILSNHIIGVGISSSVPFLTTLIAQLCERNLPKSPLIISGTTNTGMKIHYVDPSQLGPDRICSAIAAQDKYGAPLIVVDFGTATTYGVIDANGDFLGGAISLGVKSTIEALSRRTASLPSTKLQNPTKSICTDTASAMQAGCIFSAVDGVNGMVKRIRLELGTNAQVVATGGLSAMMSNLTDVIHVCDPTLVLQGVRLVWERNREMDSSSS
jgi:type III pantothenate kinase